MTETRDASSKIANMAANIPLTVTCELSLAQWQRPFIYSCGSWASSQYVAGLQQRVFQKTGCGIVSCQSLEAWLQKVLSCHFCYILLIKQTMKKVYIQGRELDFAPQLEEQQRICGQLQFSTDIIPPRQGKQKKR